MSIDLFFKYYIIITATPATNNRKNFCFIENVLHFRVFNPKTAGGGLI